MTAGFHLEKLTFGYGPCPVLDDINVTIEGAGLTAILGPNGAGKSTLLGILTGLREGYQGTCRFGGRDLAAWNRKDLARQISLVPQSLRLDFPFTAEQVVLMGRTPYADSMFETEEDWTTVEEAMRLTDTLLFRGRDFRTLSGGERQRVVLASALAQKPRVLLLDEPTTYLDLEHQLAIYGLLRDLAAQGMLVITVTHDLNLALGFANRLLVLRGGRLVADGPTLTAQQISEVFRVSVEMVNRPDGRPWIAYGG